jgi:ABC-type Na+ efflux pump permease subunit
LGVAVTDEHDGEAGERHFHHADGAFHDLLAGRYHRAGLLAPQHRVRDFRGVAMWVIRDSTTFTPAEATLAAISIARVVELLLSTMRPWQLMIVFAALGALVSRQENVGGAIMPVLMVVIAGYVVGISVLPTDPGNALAEVLSIIPLFAPTLMPMRLAMGGVPVWEAGLSVALVVALIPVLIWFAGRIYRNAVLRTGAKVKLRDALRSA